MPVAKSTLLLLLLLMFVRSAASPARTTPHDDINLLTIQVNVLEQPERHVSPNAKESFPPSLPVERPKKPTIANVYPARLPISPRLQSSTKPNSTTALSSCASISPMGKPRPHFGCVLLNLRLDIFLWIARRIPLLPELENFKKGPFTVFAPNDRAFINFRRDPFTDFKIINHYLHFHVLKGRIMIENIQNEIQWPSMLGGDKPLRFNIYPNATTLQCAPINKSDVNHLADNGVVHELTQVITPPVGSILDALRHGQQFKTFLSLINGTHFQRMLRFDSPITLFVPTDTAFEKLPRPFRNLILANVTARTDLLKYHMAMGTYCLAGLYSHPTVKTMNGEKVKVTASAAGAYGHIWINDAAILVEGEDGSVTNGVMQTLNKVLVPPSLRSHFALHSSTLLFEQL